MNLSVKCLDIVLSLTSPSEDDSSSSEGAGLQGVASFDEPTDSGDFGSPWKIPDGIGRKVPTSVRLVTAADWVEGIEQLTSLSAVVRSQHADAIRAVGKRSATMPAYLSYFAADPTGARGPSSRENSFDLNLRVETEQWDALVRRLELAVLKPDFMPEISVHQFKFFREDRGVAETGVPCWDRVVEGIYVAPAPWYTIQFSTRNITSKRGQDLAE